MKLLSIIFIFVLSYLRTDAQEIKKITIAELDSIIHQSNHPLVINFWATYCNPCIREIPYLQSEILKFRDSGVILLLVSLDPPKSFPQDIVAFAERNKITATIFWLAERNNGHNYPAIDKRWDGGMPASLFIDNTTGYRRFFDRQLTEAQVGEAVRLMLKKP